MKYKKHSIVKFDICDFGFANPKYNEYLGYWSFGQVVNKYFKNESLIKIFDCEKIKVERQDDDTMFSVTIYNSQIDNLEEVFEKCLESDQLHLGFYTAYMKEEEYKKDEKISDQRLKDIKALIDHACFVWCINNKDLPERIQNSKDWLNETFYDGEIYLELSNCVGDWQEDNNVKVLLFHPTMGDILKSINNSFLEFKKEKGSFDHIFLESIDQIKYKINDIPVFTCEFGS
jgi:hypothetical protein